MRRGRDVMTAEVVVVRDRTPFKEIAKLMRQHGGAPSPWWMRPMNSSGRLEADLLMKEEHVADGGLITGSRAGGVGSLGRKLAVLSRRSSCRRRPRRSTQGAARAAARLMHERRVKRLPVVDTNGKVVGIVSRGCCLKVFLRADGEIATRSRTRSRGRRSSRVRSVSRLWMASRRSRDRSRAEKPDAHVIVGIARAVDGVVDVEPRLSHEVDDVTPRLEFLTPWDRTSRPDFHRA